MDNDEAVNTTTAFSFCLAGLAFLELLQTKPDPKSSFL